ncbi:T9SS type A sorting domain-containing protein [Hymenobacter sp. B81]|uniref:T9SS type A sorting domain-containing protein n=1 Tax=Hymenobacter sp. B81 TaxID=3344878 RepID=UPI0037DC543A
MKVPLYLLYRVSSPVALVLRLLLVLLPTVSLAAPEPTAQPTVTVTPVSGTSSATPSVLISVSGGNGANRLVTIRTGGSTINPTDGTVYGTTTTFGSGPTTGAGNYVVLAGTATSVTVTGLTAGSTYVVSTYAYNQDGSAPVTNYLTAAPGTASFRAFTTYTWVGAAGANWGTAGSWSPSRTSPQTNDVLVFDGGTPSPVLNVNDAVAQISLINNADATFSFPVGQNQTITRTISLAGASGDDFSIAPGSRLTVQSTLGNNADGNLILALATGATASLAGEVRFTASGGNPQSVVNHRFTGDAGSVAFATNGSLVTDGKYTGSPFGATAGMATFQAGSSFNQQAGTDPYGPALFQAGSSYTFGGGTFAGANAGGTATLTADRTYGSLTFASGITVAGATRSLSLYNNLAVGTGATVALNQSRLQFIGSGAQSVSSAGTLTLGTGLVMEIANTSPAGVTLNTPLTLRNGLALTSGRLNTATGLLTLLTTTTVSTPIPGGITNVNNTSFVNGPMARVTPTSSGAIAVNESNGTGLFFPIGAGTLYRPVALSLTQTTATATTYQAQVQRAVPPQLPVSGDVQRVSHVRFYTLGTNGASAFSNGSVKLYFGLDDEVDDAAKLRVAKSQGSTWASLGGTATPAQSGTTAFVGTITSTSPFTTLGNFLLASTAALGTAGNNPLPVVLSSFTAARHGQQVRLAWATASEKNSARFEVQRSLNGKDFNPVGVLEAAGTSAQPRHYAFADEAAPASAAYYRLRQLDLDGTATLSRVVAIPQTGHLMAELFPNPVYDKLHLQAGASALPWRVLGADGKVLLQGTAAGEAIIDVSRLKVGTYTLELRRGGQRETHRFVHLQ